MTGPHTLHDPAADVTLVGEASQGGVQLGVRAPEPWYAAGVHIPTSHPAFPAALALVHALDPAGTEPAGADLRASLAALAAGWERGADLDPALDDLGDLAAAGQRRACAAQLRALLAGGP